MVVLLILIGAFFEARACLFDAREGIDLKSLKQGAFLEYMPNIWLNTCMWGVQVWL